MTLLGKINKLKVVKSLDFGFYLDGEDKGEILLPIKQVPKGTEIGSTLDVFIYKDSEDRIIATTEKPFGMVGEFVLLRTQEVNKIGAFMDWGLVKNLLVPFGEQKKRMEVGRWYIVYIYVDDETERIVGSAKLDKFLNIEPPQYVEKQEVNLLIRKKTEMGYTAIVNNAHSGMLYNNEIFQDLNVGQKVRGFVKKMREDGKIDLSINRSGFKQIDSVSKSIIELLEENNNYIAITDKSDPQLIYDTFAVSKKNFKKAIGNLYKNRLILIEEEGIRLKD